MCFSDRLPRNLALRSYRHRPVGSGEMRNFLSEHSGAFDPDEVHTLVAAFDKAWETIQASGVVYPEVKAEVRAILAKHIIAAAMHGERDHARWRSTGLGSIKSDAPDPLR